MAHTLTSLPKLALTTLGANYAIGTKSGQIVLFYHPQRILLGTTAEHLTDLQEELLHLLLLHPTQQAKYTELWAFHLAADLAVAPYLTSVPAYPSLQERLRLSPPWNLNTLYQRILELTAAHGQEQLWEWMNYSPVNRKTHDYWSAEGEPSSSSLWRNYLEQQERQWTDLGITNLRPLGATSTAVNPVSWRIILQQFARNGQRAILKNSYRRASKRYGTLPGTRRLRSAHLLAIIDTSGSVNSELLNDFFIQLCSLQQQQHQITVVEVDYQLRQVYSFKGIIPSELSGGGHTLFTPALEYAQANGPFDGVVYFTDGEGQRPEGSYDFPLLWVVYGETRDMENWPGNCCFM